MEKDFLFSKYIRKHEFIKWRIAPRCILYFLFSTQSNPPLWLCGFSVRFIPVTKQFRRRYIKENPSYRFRLSSFVHSIFILQENPYFYKFFALINEKIPCPGASGKEVPGQFSYLYLCNEITNLFFNSGIF